MSVFLKNETRAACLAVALLATSGCSEKIDTHLEFTELAHQHERSGELPEAVNAYKKAIELDADVSTTWYDMGVAYAGMDQFTDAVEAYTKSIELDPGMAMAYNNRAAAYARLKQYERAVDDCSEALLLEPGDFLAWRNRGLAYHDLNEFEKAIADYDESIRLNGQIAETYHYRGNVYLDRKQFERALEDFNHAIHLNKNLAPAWLSRAEAEARLGKHREAEESLAQAKAVDPNVEAIDLNKFAPEAPAVVESATQRQLAVSFVQAELTEAALALSNQSPWDFVNTKDANQKVIVRIANDEGQAVLFSAKDLRAINDDSQADITLIVVALKNDGDSKGPSFTIVERLESWRPDTTAMSPVVFSMPVTSATTSEAGTSSIADDLAIAR